MAVPVSLLLRPVVLVQRHLMGIEVIHVSGNADNAEFIQTERITAGAYDYIPKRGQGLTALTGI